MHRHIDGTDDLGFWGITFDPAKWQHDVYFCGERVLNVLSSEYGEIYSHHNIWYTFAHISSVDIIFSF